MPNPELVFKMFASGFWNTLWLSVASFAVALVLGAILAMMQVSPAPPAKWAAQAYTAFFRNTPLLVILILFGFGLPKLQLQLDPWQWALIGLGMYTSAFVGETLRSGINSISLGQAEAARSIGLTFGQSLRHVILPQAFRTVIPPLGTLYTALVKNTALTLVLGFQELAAKTELMINQDMASVWIVVGGIIACYLIINLPTSWFISRAEKRAAFAR
ncbi:amino acid ABC transporter permease [Phytomonospora sp. NPDC050363]|uniref:amino acid ABC transporter permease n=1 Tax=Phytomonospora sp. NPDC050363 TaxID=3155642 RepID=UPI0033FBBBB4